MSLLATPIDTVTCVCVTCHCCTPKLVLSSVVEVQVSEVCKDKPFCMTTVYTNDQNK